MMVWCWYKNRSTEENKAQKQIQEYVRFLTIDIGSILKQQGMGYLAQVRGTNYLTGKKSEIYTICQKIPDELENLDVRN